MAVSIDAVYQKVLAFANKEQRGYITPQEFNLFAHQAQMEIFEQYFYDVNQWTRQHGNDSAYSDMLTNLQEKIDLFNTYVPRVNIIDEFGVFDMDSIPNLHRIGRIGVTYDSHPNLKNQIAEYVTFEEDSLHIGSSLVKPTKKRPTYTRFLNPSGRKFIKILPNPQKPVLLANGSYDYTDTVQVFYTRKPKFPNWNYVVVNDKALYNSTESTDFELHPSEESELVYRILAFAGISMQKPNLTQTAAGLEQAKVQQEKQ